MSAVWKDTRFFTDTEEEMAAVLAGWFSVSGDIDDFIFFGDTSREQSEK